MSSRPPLPPGPFLVVGLARSGEAIARALRERGERVIGTDSGDPERLGDAVGRLQAAGVEVALDASADALAAAATTIVKSPGVPQSAPVVRAARDHGRAVVGELELAWRMLPNPFIAVTGTNGKTTTTEWIGHLHRVAGLPVAVAGNVGTALSTLPGAVDPAATVVCEASSFQLEDTVAFAPEIAVLLNLTPDHLDRHGSFQAYAEAKLRIFANQTGDEVAIIPPGFPAPVTGAAIRVYGEGAEAALAGEIRLPGEHNRANGLAAAAAALAAGVPAGAVAEGLRTFAGVVHRLELIATADGVAYVNDSKATNVDSTLVALRAFPSGVHLIAGGTGKAQDFSPLATLVAERCAAVWLIGRDGHEIGEALASAGVPVPVHDAGDLAAAVTAAARAARPGETVLLSPACASFDQYPNFEARGEHFRSLVTALEARR